MSLSLFKEIEYLQLIVPIYTFIVLLIIKYRNKPISWDTILSASLIVPVILFGISRIISKGITEDLVILFIAILILTFFILLSLKKFWHFIPITISFIQLILYIILLAMLGSYLISPTLALLIVIFIFVTISIIFTSLIRRSINNEISWYLIYTFPLLFPIILLNISFIFISDISRYSVACLISTILPSYFILVTIKNAQKNISWYFIYKNSFLFPIILYGTVAILYLTIDFVTSPMTVHMSDIEGEYIINTDIFKGKDADWQYEHYWLKVKNDTLYLNVMNNGELIRTYKRRVYQTWKKKHEFIEFYDEWQFRGEEVPYVRINTNKDTNNVFKTRGDTTYLYRTVKDSVFYYKMLKANELEHHMLKLNPLLSADPFMFNLILRSTKYGNMFFKKGKWKKNKK